MRSTLAVLISVVMVCSLSRRDRGFAHANAVAVPVLPAATERPAINGACNRTEYLNAARFLIPSASAGRPIRAYVQAYASTNLLSVCLEGLPVDAGRRAHLALTLDNYHSGGDAPGPSQNYYSVREDGRVRTTYGTTEGGWRPLVDCDCPGRVRVNEGEVTWAAEFQFGAGRPGRRFEEPVGLGLRVDTAPGVIDAAWPAGVNANNPNSWGDLVFFERTPGPAVALDVGRVSQGLEVDLNTRGRAIPYDFLAGKDTIVLAQLYNSGAPRTLVDAECEARGVGYVRRVPARVLGGTLNRAPVGMFNGGEYVQCRFPGALLEPRLIQFYVNVTVSGEGRRSFFVDSRTFIPASNMRLKLYPSTLPPGTAGRQEFTASMRAAALTAVTQLSRAMPVRSGVGSFDRAGGAPLTPRPGVRIEFAPFIIACTEDQLTEDCELRQYVDSNLDLFWDNAGLSALNADGRQRDLFDKGAVLIATSGGGGGRACWPEPFFYDLMKTSVNRIDTESDSAAGATLIQEVAHCYGQVDHWGRIHSPHAMPGNPWHARPGAIPLQRFDLPAVDTLAEMLQPAPLTVMGPSAFSTSQAYLEGYEWNDLGVVMASGRPSDNDGASAGNQVPVLVIAAAVHDDDAMTYYDSRAYGGAGAVPLTGDDPASEYRLALKDKSGKTLSVRGFPVSFETTHPEPGAGTQPEREAMPLLLTVPAPAGTASFEVTRNGKPLLERTVSATAPVVSGLNAAVKSNVLSVAWGGTDAEDDPLVYNVFLRGEDGTSRLAVSATTSTAADLPLDFAPGGSFDVIVEASDGFNTGSATLKGVALPDQPPAVAIVTPVEGADLVEGQPIVVTGVAYDPSSGVLDGKALEWSVDGLGKVGVGDRLLLRLKAGRQTIQLVATTPIGKSATQSITVEVLPDTDRDGLEDAYEKANKCLSPGSSSPKLEDLDGDGLKPLAEKQHGTDPCSPDTDGDGATDTQELLRGSDPLKKSSRPARPAIVVTERVVDLGSCPKPSSTAVKVEAASKRARWLVASDAKWLALPKAGRGDGLLRPTVDCAGLGHGRHAAHVYLTTAHDVESLVFQLRVP